MLVQRIVRAYDRYNEMIGTGRQLALRLGNANTAEVSEVAATRAPGSENASETLVEAPAYPSVA